MRVVSGCVGSYHKDNIQRTKRHYPVGIGFNDTGLCTERPYIDWCCVESWQSNAQRRDESGWQHSQKLKRLGNEVVCYSGLDALEQRCASSDNCRWLVQLAKVNTRQSRLLPLVSWIWIQDSQRANKSNIWRCAISRQDRASYEITHHFVNFPNLLVQTGKIYLHMRRHNWVRDKIRG